MGHGSDISSLLAIHKPRVVVGEDGVGSITRREDALSSQPTTVNSIPGASRAKSVCNTPPNADYHWATPVTLDADIKSFTTSKDTIVAAPLKDVFESVINILCLVKEKMAEESSFVELARLCSRACHALQAVDGLAGFGEHIEGLRRCVSPA
ncbi:hypothetical protein BJ322DRAFT_524672 [Thelephora terrestris]|uniref:Uncharacterized protein n=1 Tax=Thelephora terrestris TaxID=56493 RepID=A0A9P6HKJ0_9AGAM|nr:hypothetical protein BJ322DRAFT_524672 [Thelephora terrestris]